MRKDFFISYNSTDKAWAVWVAWVLEAQGFTTIIQEWDFRPGGDFVLEMQKAATGTKQTIAVLSENYLSAEYTQPEWSAAFAVDPKGCDRKLIPIRIANCDPDGLLKARIYVDLVGLKEDEARATLLASLQDRGKPLDQPSFPGNGGELSHKSVPVFPGQQAEFNLFQETKYSRYRHLSEELSQSLIRKSRIEQIGEDTTTIDDDILSLKRELRRGGQLRQGDQLGDRYLLLNQIGRGGYATVWNAFDQQTASNVAIKALNCSEASNNESVERFFRGARVMSDLSGNDGIVSVLNPKCEDDGFLYFVMELISGGNLREAVHHGRKSRADAVAIMQRILSILNHTHSHPSAYIHRDIKPTNVLLTSEDQLKLTDFDLVTMNNTTGGTRTGMLGTFVFAAPEQLHRPQEADHRADIFAVGMTGMFVLYGQDLPPSAWRRPEAFIDALNTTTDLKTILEKATAEDPNDRFASASEFLDALQHRQSTSTPKKQRTRRRRKASDNGSRRQPKRHGTPRPRSRTKLLKALAEFDAVYRTSGRYRNFPNGKHGYAIQFEDRLYPVKKIVSLATGRPVETFTGGANSVNRVVESLGFKIVELNREAPT
ncbi:protein kinase domain-containing protein [Rubinisphaera margarita]|uniref:protein kinase domain-containing protein n=1 Tax=Rubinisphaera margarita TaxID=2909586 RepID=UPI001EE7C2F5|nr:TIR domain-containing protein [Rubinisphaera margarita]MCG6157721.1 TIR domain-containing protein [Rubinisphaera margarita]